MNKKFIIIGFFSVLLLLAIIFYFWLNFNTSDGGVFSLEKVPNSDQTNNKQYSLFSIEKSAPAYISPITGEIFESSTPSFSLNVPIAVMVNNAIPARPQSGINQADLVYEIVAEGGITRFLAIYHSKLPKKVGPVRSVREYYLNYVKDLGDSMLMHIGYSPQALQRIGDWNIKTLTNVSGSFYRDNHGDTSVAIEHTAYSNLEDLLSKGQNLGFNEYREIPSYKFKDTKLGISEGVENASSIEVSFWYRGDYTSIFEYEPTKNIYLRSNGFDDLGIGMPTLDRTTGEQLSTRNLIVMFAEEFPIPNDDKNRLDYKLIGEGSALVFLDGLVIKSRWKKDSIESRTRFYNEKGDEIQFNRGSFWISVVPSRNLELVVYK